MQALGRAAKALKRAFETEEGAERRLAAVPRWLTVKLELLDEQSATAIASVRDLQAKILSATDEHDQLAAELPKYEAAEGEHKHNAWFKAERHRVLADGEMLDLSRLPVIRHRVAEVTEDLARLNGRMAGANAAWNAAGTINRRCVEWARDHDPDAHAETRARTDAVSRRATLPADRLGAELDAVRATLQAVAEERRGVERAGVPLALARSRMRAHLDAIARSYEPETRGLLRHDWRDSPGMPESRLIPPMNAPALTSFLVHALREPIEAMLSASLEREAQRMPLLLDPAARDLLLAELDLKAFQLGVREERIILTAESQGPTVLRRRGDADPAVVVATMLA